jgi:formylglycine-generating enzyme required for sulfatase activity
MGSPSSTVALVLFLGAVPAVLPGSARSADHRKTVTLPEVGIELVPIPGGEFMMGSDDGPEGEGPSHRVLVKGYYLAKHEITQSQWERVMGSNPARFKGCAGCPAEQVSWEAVQGFLGKASALTERRLRLPTEAEWEYAAGGGSVHQRWPGTDRKEDSSEYVWYSGNFAGKTRPVGLKFPNAYALYDMGGNVAEWCADWYGKDYYRVSPEEDPGGPAGGGRRVVRGGSWLSGPDDTRTARRSGRSPSTRSPTLGFRVAMDLTERTPEEGLDTDD